jgi:hypothetical protein
MRVPRMTARRWMIAAAVVALICAGLFTGCPRLAAAPLVCLVLAPFVLTFYVLARRMGLNTLFR